jgi:hypothetical protein
MPPRDRWRILITNVTLASRTGTEIVVRDLAIGLRALGFEPMVYSPELGELAAEIQAAGIPVVKDIRLVPDEPHIVHGHHHVETIEALMRFPRARGLFVCHDRTIHMSAPPRLDRILRYVAVDYNCLERLTGDYAIPAALTSVIYNAVDIDRLPQRAPLPPAPARALVFSNYAGPGTHLDAVQVACAMLKIPLDVIGAAMRQTNAAPEDVLGQYDLVFAKARCALEALAVGAAVVLCDTHGLGPMVTMRELAALRRWNFGRRTLREVLDPGAIVSQVQRYDPADARDVSDFIRTHATLATAVDQYARLYDEMMAEPLPTPPASPARELAAYAQASATRVYELEQELIELRKPYRMEPLSDIACAQLALRLHACPAMVECARPFGVRVQLENGSSEKLASFAPYPLHLGYRWLDAERDAAIDGVGETPRTVLRPALQPDEKAIYALHVIPPDRPGRYRLRATLVQEGVMWLDTIATPVIADAIVTVV